MSDPSVYQILGVEEREALSLAIGKIPYLAHLGKRLLADLNDRSSTHGTVRGLSTESVVELPIKTIGAPAEITAPLLAISVLRGSVQASAQSDATGTTMDLSAGTYGREEAGLAGVEIGKLKLSPHPALQDRLLYAVAHPDFLKVSPILASRVIAGAHGAMRQALQNCERRELIWFDADDAHVDLLRPLAHALATAAARSGRNTAILDCEYAKPVRKWDGQGFYGEPFDPQLDPRDILPRDVPGSIYVIASRHASLPKEVLAKKFDRIVYVSDEIPARVPERFRGRLHDELFDKKTDKDLCEPYFVSFVTSCVVGSRGRANRKPRRFRTLPIAHARVEVEEDKTPRGLRLYRDACVVPVHRAALRRAWAKWLPDADDPQAKPFLDAAVQAEALQISTAERWARAVAIKRAGVALSGGGASSYRFVPVLSRLAREKIAVDVFTGLSGGALLGAYYCTQELEGLRKYVGFGPLSQLLFPFVFSLPDLNEQILNAVLDSARVEDLQIRLGIVAVELPDDGPPCGVVIRTGTVAEAARASSTLPPVFSPTEKNGVRYADGGACTFVPARIARDCGADVIYACNAIPGPDECNPFPANVYGTILRRFLRRLPGLDRLIDYRSWFWFQLQQSSRAFADEADVKLEFEPSQISLAEPTLFVYARQIAAEAARHPRLGKSVTKFEEKLGKLV